LLDREGLFRVLVADLHVVDASGDAAIVDGAYKGIVETMGVHQPAVADGAIEHLEFGPVGDPGGLLARLLGWVLGGCV
jgi:hypothetical protein